MKIASMIEPNEVKKNIIFIAVIIAIICAFVFSGLIQLTFIFLSWLIKLIIEHWIKVLIGFAVLLVLKRFFRKTKSKIQPVRIVR